MVSVVLLTGIAFTITWLKVTSLTPLCKIDEIEALLVRDIRICTTLCHWIVSIPSHCCCRYIRQSRTLLQKAGFTLSQTWWRFRTGLRELKRHMCRSVGDIQKKPSHQVTTSSALGISESIQGAHPTANLICPQAL
jgi:hypothetical protein